MTDTEVCTLNDKTYDHVSNYGERQEYIYLSKHIYNPCFCLLPCLLSSLSSSSQLRCIPTSHNKRPWLNSYITSYETSTRTHRFLKMLQQVCSPSTAAPSASNIHHLTTNSSPALDLRHIWDKMIKKPPRVTHRSNNFPFFFSFLHPSQGVTACLRHGLIPADTNTNMIPSIASCGGTWLLHHCSPSECESMVMNINSTAT